MVLNREWQQCQTHVFWGEIAPSDHVVQIYEDNNIFLDTLVDFVGNGVNAGDCVVVIATTEHLQALSCRLSEYTLKVHTLISEGQYIPLDARACLAEFMINGFPDEQRFTRFITHLLHRARNKNRQVRAFGEMVALLWEEGNTQATVELEHLWNKFMRHEEFCLFCAYPKSSFSNDDNSSLKDICCTHSKVISGDSHYRNKLLYQTLEYDERA